MKLRVGFIVLVALIAGLISPVAAVGAVGNTPAPATGVEEMPPDLSKMHVGMLFFVIANTGTDADTLVSIEAEVALNADILGAKTIAGEKKMLVVNDGVEIPAGARVVVKPGSDYRVMLTGIAESQPEGTQLKVTLHFEKAGDVELLATVRPPQPDFAKDPVDVVTAGNLEITNYWVRQAPKVGGPMNSSGGGGNHGNGMNKGTPVATPGAD